MIERSPLCSAYKRECKHEETILKLQQLNTEFQEEKGDAESLFSNGQKLSLFQPTRKETRKGTSYRLCKVPGQSEQHGAWDTGEEKASAKTGTFANLDSRMHNT